MIRIFALIAAIFAGAQLAEAQDSAGIEATIDGQMRAFQAEDEAQAFSYASPMIQGMFRDAAIFSDMVRRGYPMVWENEEVRFLELREINGGLWQRVLIRDEAGGVHVLEYNMIELNGEWRIDGVQLVPASDVGA